MANELAFPQMGGTPAGQSQAGGAAGVDVLNQLLNQSAALSTQAGQATKVAMTPVARAGTGVTPGLALKPIQPYKDSPFITQQTVGAKSTRAKGIANTIIGAANLVGNVENKAAEEKQRTLAVDLERVMQATDGVQQAQDALKADPNNQQAKGVLDQNQRILDGLLSDPKRRKQIAKALDVNFTDPDANKTPENAALQEATKSYSQQLQSQIPSGMGVNPQAIQQLQAIQQRQGQVDKMITSLAPSVIRSQSQADTNAQKWQQSLNTIQANAEKTSQEIQGRYQQAIATTKLREQGEWARTQFKAQADMDRTLSGIELREKLMENRGLSGDKATAATQKNLQMAMKSNAEATTQINSLKILRDQLQNNKRDDVDKDARLQSYNQSIHFWEDQLGDSSRIMKTMQDKLSGAGGTTSGNNGSSTKSTTITSSGTVGKQEDSSDENSDIYGTDDNNEQ